MSSDTSKRYALRGVSAGKEDVHNAIKNIDKGLFPQAFCKIVPDYLTQDGIALCMQMEQELNLLWHMYWKETGDISVWKALPRMH
jgi:phosphoribosylformylglycinamidine cyclo-ligase